jgi:hypothetical protein
VGPRRLVFEMGRRCRAAVTHSTVYGTLAGNGLIEPESRRRRRKDYRRWERSSAMELPTIWHVLQIIHSFQA